MLCCQVSRQSNAEGLAAVDSRGLLGNRHLFEMKLLKLSLFAAVSLFFLAIRQFMVCATLVLRTNILMSSKLFMAWTFFFPPLKLRILHAKTLIVVA